jgi:crooked neck
MQNWLRYAKFEIRNGAISNARAVYERALEFFGEQHVQSKLLIAFAKFEESQKEVW